MGTHASSAFGLTLLRKLCCPSVMKVLVTLVVVAVLVLGVAEAKRPGGRPLLCFMSLCTTSADSDNCKSCVKDLHDTIEVPKEDIKACFDAVEGGCRNISDDDLSTLRTCVTSASAEVGACIAA